MLQICKSLILFFIVTSCTSVNQVGNGRRSPANESGTIDEPRLTQFVRDVLAFHQTENKTFKVTHFPVNDPTDVEPEAAAQEIERAFANPAFLDSWKATANIYYQTEVLENFRQIITKNFSLQERNTLLNVCFSLPVGVGDTFYASSYLVGEICRWAGFFHTTEEFIAAMNAFPKIPKGVRYDGDYGYHRYEDKILESKVQIITSAINLNRENIYKLYHNLPAEIKNKFSSNHYDASEASKNEPFDLISTYSTAFFIKKNMGADQYTGATLNKIQISKLAQKALARFFHMTQKEHEQINKVPSLTISRSENAVGVLCANGMFPRRESQRSGAEYWFRGYLDTDLVESWNPEHKLTSFVQKGFSAQNLTCNLIDYRFLFQKIPAEVIPPPSDLDFASKKDIHGLMTVSLVSEIDHAAVYKAKLFVKTLTGWEIEEDVQSVNTLDYLNQKFSQFDLYFPVMHSMDVNYFNIGTINSLLIKIRKKVVNKNGNNVTLHLHVLLPDGSKSFEGLTFKPEDLARLLDLRYQTQKSSMFIMNNSCASEKTLLAWSLVYRKALKLRQARGDRFNLDMPHIIGSTRYFGTSGLMEIFSHSTYPLKSFELLAKGSSVAEVVEFLKKPQETGILSGLSNFFSKDPNAGLEEGEGFAPVYIMEYPELLSMGGIKITVTSRAIKGQDEY